MMIRFLFLFLFSTMVLAQTADQQQLQVQKQPDPKDCPPEGMPVPAETLNSMTLGQMSFPKFQAPVAIDKRLCEAVKSCEQLDSKTAEAKLQKSMEDYYLNLPATVEKLKSLIAGLKEVDSQSPEGSSMYGSGATSSTAKAASDLEKKLATAQKDLEEYKAYLADPKTKLHPMKAKGIGLSPEEKEAHKAEQAKKMQAQILVDMEKNYEMLPQTIEYFKTSLKKAQDLVKQLEIKGDKQELESAKLQEELTEKALMDKENDYQKYQAHLKDPKNIPHPMKEKGFGLTPEEKKPYLLKQLQNTIAENEKQIEKIKTDYANKDQITDPFKKSVVEWSYQSLPMLVEQVKQSKEILADPAKLEPYLKSFEGSMGFGSSGGVYGGGYGSSSGSMMGMGLSLGVNSSNKCSYMHSSYKGQEVGTCGMSPEQMYGVRFYTGSGYGCLNKYLRSSDAKDGDVDFLVKTINDGLDKLPSYQGFVKRGANLPGSVREMHQAGKIVNYEAYTSTSTSDGFSGPDRFFIYSESGKPIMSISGIQGEDEVLFKSKTKFKVLEVTKKNEINFYVMREVTGEESAEEASKRDQEILSLAKADRAPATETSTADKAKPSKIFGFSQGDGFACPLQDKGEIPKIIKQQIIPSWSY